MNNLELDKVQNVRNGMPPLMFYQMSYLQTYLKNNNLTFDYIIRTRNDLEIILKESKKYFDNNTYVPPTYWRLSELNTLLNANFFILPYQKYMELDFSISNIIQQSNISWDCEELFSRLVYPDTLISNDEIRIYRQHGGCKINIQNID